MFGTYMVTWTSRLRKKKKRNAANQASVGEGVDVRLQVDYAAAEDTVAEAPENLIPADQLPSAAAALAELFPPEKGASESSSHTKSASLFSSAVDAIFSDPLTESTESRDASVLSVFETAKQLLQEPKDDRFLPTLESAVPVRRSLVDATPESFLETLIELNKSVSHQDELPGTAAHTPTMTSESTSARRAENVSTEARTVEGKSEDTNPRILAPKAENRPIAYGLADNALSAPSVSFATSSSPASETHAPEMMASMEAAPVLEKTAEKVNMPFLSDLPAAAAPTISLHGISETGQASPHNGPFEEQLSRHREWVESRGKSGKKVDFVGADLEGTELISVNLRFADLRDANLRATDLLLADLRDSSLMRANLQDACLVGANLEGANLEGAALETAMGLVPRQLAGANLREASLPQAILKFEAAPEFERGSHSALRFFVTTISLSLLSWLAIWRTRDIQLVSNLSIIPFLHSPAAAAAMPTDQFYLIAPVALFIVYVVFLFHLQRLWDATLALPAVFPDGRMLGENTPKLVMGLLRSHFRWMNQQVASTRWIEKAGTMVIAYWLAPFTLFLFWARYLTLQDMRGTILQAILIAAAAGIAIYATTRVGRPEEKWNPEPDRVQRAVERLKKTNPGGVALALVILLVLLSTGAISGVPHEKSRAPQYAASSIRRWAPSALWSIGINPWANLTEAGLSSAPAEWSGTDDKLNVVKGARLNGLNFRYAQAYGVFLASAHLRQTDFQGAFLSAADLRGADLGQSNLRFAVLDQARMSRANLDRANLEGANLGRADLREANLSYGLLSDAFMLDSRLDNAVLYQAQLKSVTLARANLEKADLRGAHLENGNLDYADMKQSYLWSAKLAGAHLDNADLASAIFIDADLSGTDLRGAQFRGTVLNGANFTGSNLDGVDLQSVSGLSADQICSAKSRRWVMLADALQAQVTAQCGAAH